MTNTFSFMKMFKTKPSSEIIDKIVCLFYLDRLKNISSLNFVGYWHSNNVPVPDWSILVSHAFQSVKTSHGD